MATFDVDGAALVFQVRGEGPALTFRRRGYGGSSRAQLGRTLGDEGLAAFLKGNTPLN